MCFVIALSGPLIGSKLVEFKQKGLDIFIAVDCSLSMQAEDLKPNRMAHAKLVLGQLVDRLAGSRIGIIAFAGQAYLLVIPGGHKFYTRDASHVRLRDEGEVIAGSATAPCKRPDGSQP